MRFNSNSVHNVELNETWEIPREESRSRSSCQIYKHLTEMFFLVQISSTFYSHTDLFIENTIYPVDVCIPRLGLTYTLNSNIKAMINQKRSTSNKNVRVVYHHQTLTKNFEVFSLGFDCLWEFEIIFNLPLHLFFYIPVVNRIYSPSTGVETTDETPSNKEIHWKVRNQIYHFVE